MSDADPVLELLGWFAEPTLLRRLWLYITEGVIEGTALLVAMCLADLQLHPPGLFVRLLMMPLVVVTVKVVWAIRLACGYCRIKGTDIATGIRRMGCVHTRGFWTCSAAMFTCFSCVLMVWHAILFLLMTGYEPKPEESFAARFLLGTSGVFVVTNWLLWRDFVRNYREMPEEPDAPNMHRIFEMYKAGVIHLCKYKDLARPAGAAQAAEEEPPAPSSQATQPTCVVCLEDFAPEEDVSQLPCGHVFHPTCAHKWIREDWRCPFRCSLESAQSPKAAGLGAVYREDAIFDLEPGVVLYY
mmetsp:Transcript_33480/g.106140  ORF Transcript_33480/g.106140 Transcript_33480/m.106140 type:complete len:299 (+) Transcript_33480:54-950(+)